MENKMRKDIVDVPCPNFMRFKYRNEGHIEVVATSDIKSIQGRGEGGTSIRLQNDRVILTDIKIGDVLNALKDASEGGDHAAAL
jgi:hypothetical protein